VARLIGISGSLRKGSYNTALLRAAAECAPPGTEVEVATCAGIPLYDADLEEAQGIPAAVAALKDRVAAADGLVIATPEYNHGIPGVLKNTIDWLSRPPADIGRVFGGKPVAILGATPGAGGSQNARTRSGYLFWVGEAPFRAGPVFASRLTPGPLGTRRLRNAVLHGGFL